MTTLSPDPGFIPPPELRFRRSLRPGVVLADLWNGRNLVRTLAERQLRAQYKQAWFGIAWAIATPVVTMIVFTVFFKRVARIETGEVPYPLFSFVALVPWQFFAAALQSASQALVTNKFLLNKLSCPREIYPLASIAVAAVNFAIASTVLGILFLAYRFPPAVTAPLGIIPLAIQVAFTVGLVLIFAPLAVYARDLVHALPLIMQVGLFATPIAYSIDAIPARYHVLYTLANPLAPIMESYRSLLLGYGPVPWSLLGLSAIVAGVTLLIGITIFKRMEAGVADIA